MDNHVQASTIPDLPTLQPWVNSTTSPPATALRRSSATHYYHRVDDQWPAAALHRPKWCSRSPRPQADSGQDRRRRQRSAGPRPQLQATIPSSRRRNPAAPHEDWTTYLWQHRARLALLALYPNLNASDPVWRELLRDVSFRRALSHAIDRDEINQIALFRSRHGRATTRRAAAAVRCYKARPSSSEYAEFDHRRRPTLLLGRRSASTNASTTRASGACCPTAGRSEIDRRDRRREHRGSRPTLWS